MEQFFIGFLLATAILFLAFRTTANQCYCTEEHCKHCDSP